jgi:hypothetical protein
MCFEKRFTLGVLLAGSFAMGLLGSDVGAASWDNGQPPTAGDGPVPRGGTGVLAIPAAAFRPSQPSHDFVNSARYLTSYTPGTITYVANVDLPNGATVTKLSFYWCDEVDEALVEVDLYAYHLMNHTVLVMASATSPEPPWPGIYGETVETNIVGPVIDTSLYCYTVAVKLPEQSAGCMKACAVVLEYLEPPASASGTTSLSASAFEPYEDGYDYLNSVLLYYGHGPGGSPTNGWFVSQLDLPQDAILSTMRFYWSDTDPSYNAVARIQRTELGLGDFVEIASVTSAGSPGSGVSSVAISGTVVDNTRYAYWVVWDLPAWGSDQGVAGVATAIDYLLPTPAAIETSASISAAGFTSYEDAYDYTNSARYLTHRHDPAGGNSNGWYIAPLNLPQGAKVESMQFYWYHMDSTEYAVARMQRTQLGLASLQEMAYASSQIIPGSGYGVTTDSTIAYDVIDNRNYAYWLVWDLPATNGLHKGCGAVVQYLDGRVFGDGFESGGTSRWSAVAP